MAEFDKPTDLSKPWARLGDKTEPSDTKKDQGWVEEIPTFQDFNWIQNRCDQFIAHVNQMGIANWDSETEYQNLKSLTVRNSKLYVAVSTHTNQDPALDTNELYWRFLLDFSRKSKPSLAISSLSGGWTVANSFAATVTNNYLQLRGLIQDGALTASTLLYTLPAGYRPASARVFFCMCANATYTTTGIAALQVATNGEITILQAPAGMKYIELDTVVEM